MSAITDRVAAGAAFLDEHDPGWWRADAERPIDLGTLAMNCGSCDVLGQRCPRDQVSGPFSWHVLHAILLTGETSLVALGRWAHARGLSPADVGDLGECGRLTAEWKQVITTRREAAQAAGAGGTAAVSRCPRLSPRSVPGHRRAARGCAL